MTKKKYLVFIIILSLIFLLLIINFYFINKKSESIPFIADQANQIDITDKNYCLKDNEIADYKIKKNPAGGGVAEIIIKNRSSGQEKFSFQIEISNSGHYHPIEMHKCGVYVIRTFGYDYTEKAPLGNYRRELWKYKYNGTGNSLISDSAKWSHENTLGDFRVDFNEKFVVLRKNYFDHHDYAIVIKSLKILDDVFIFPFSEIEKRKPEIIGNVSFIDWSRDGRYFWADTHYGAVELGFIRIDTKNWQVDLFKSPEDVLGGDKLNVNTGYITVHPGNVWYGIAEIEEEEKEKRRKQGIGTELYIHNLIIDNRQFVDKTNEPLWYFQPEWLSDTELEYELPTGEKRIYMVK